MKKREGKTGDVISEKLPKLVRIEEENQKMCSTF